MNDKKISYLSRDYESYRDSIIALTKQYYPDIAANLTDASIGSWFVDMMAAVGDNLSYYIDRAYNETNIDTAAAESSVYALARSNGFKIPGPKGSITELKFTCSLPVGAGGNSSATYGMPSFKYAPIIKKGTRVRSTNGRFFETDKDIDFSKQFDDDGSSNLVITPIYDSNNLITRYTVSKTVTATAGISKVYKQIVTGSMIKPFMEVTIPDNGVMEIESIIFKDGSDYTSEPTISEFMSENEYTDACNSPTGTPTRRFFEVESLAQQYIWGDARDHNGDVTTYQYGYDVSGTTVPVYSVTKGEWKPVTQKFITEYTDNGYLKIIFGSGDKIGQDVDVSAAKNTTQAQISRMVRNNFLGKLPQDGTTMYVRYRTGGGAASNVAAGSINTITYLDTYQSSKEDAQIASAVIQSIEVTNTIPSVSGKDAPTVDEIKAMIKYNNASQERCVTINDYIHRVTMMPSRYGCPYKVGAVEENNKIMLYLLLSDYNGNLSNEFPVEMIDNISKYLSEYRSINDFVEIKAGRIVNLSFEIDVFVNKAFDTNSVVSEIITKVKEYMDTNKHYLGEDIYVSDIEKTISDITGVVNLIDMRIYNEYGEGYSKTLISQEIITEEGGYPLDNLTNAEIDLEASDYILNSDADEMFEIKNPEIDIRVKVKLR